MAAAAVVRMLADIAVHLRYVMTAEPAVRVLRWTAVNLARSMAAEPIVGLFSVFPLKGSSLAPPTAKTGPNPGAFATNWWPD